MPSEFYAGIIGATAFVCIGLAFTSNFRGIVDQTIEQAKRKDRTEKQWSPFRRRLSVLCRVLGVIFASMGFFFYYLSIRILVTIG